MPRSGGVYTAPSNSWNPAVEGTAIEETDWNAILADMTAAFTASTYTDGLGSTDNQLVRTDGTDARKVQGTGVTVDDSNNMSGVAALSATTLELGHASDTTLARASAGDVQVEGNLIYRAGGTDVPIADGGTGASTAAAGFRALAEGISATQGAVLYRDGSQWVGLAPGSSGQFLKTQGAGANPMWDNPAGSGDVTGPASSVAGDVVLFNGTTGKIIKRLAAGTSGQFLRSNGSGVDPSWDNPAGSGDVTAASTFGTDNSIVRADGTGKGVQSSALTIADTTGTISGFANGASLNDDSGNEVVKLGKTASAVNEATITNAATGGKPVISATGGDTNIILQLQGKGTGGVEIEGTATNDNAAAGYVGEVISSVVTSGSAVSLTTGNYATVTSISLTAGDWDVFGLVVLNLTSATGVTDEIAGISATAGSQTFGPIDTPANRKLSPSYSPGGANSYPLSAGRITLTGTTTYYLQSRSAFSGGSASAYGNIWARRSR